VSNSSKIIHLVPPNLACFAPWRESIPLFDNFRFVLTNHKYFHLRVTTLVKAEIFRI
jgi:hypothetical protein